MNKQDKAPRGNRIATTTEDTSLEKKAQSHRPHDATQNAISSFLPWGWLLYLVLSTNRACQWIWTIWGPMSPLTARTMTWIRTRTKLETHQPIPLAFQQRKQHPHLLPIWANAMEFSWAPSIIDCVVCYQRKVNWIDVAPTASTDKSLTANDAPIGKMEQQPRKVPRPWLQACNADVKEIKNESETLRNMEELIKSWRCSDKQCTTRYQVPGTSGKPSPCGLIWS